MHLFIGRIKRCLATVTLLAFAVKLMGCVSPKQLAYFQNLSNQPDSILIKRFKPTIQPGDLISIQVSSLNPEASQFFNPYLGQSLPVSSINATPTTPFPTLPGYLVADDSTISLPIVGKIMVVGQTNSTAAERIRLKIKDYVKEPTVSVHNQNFRVSVLGEVVRPSTFNIANEHLTLPEALGLAGDLTIYGRRDNVLVVREEGGKRCYARLDLTKRDVFMSPYYYLHPNDVVYIEPGKARVAGSNLALQLTPILLSALSFIAIIITRP